MQAQQEFDKKYITAGEICTRLSISKPALSNFRLKHNIPEPIEVGNAKMHLWLRTDIEPILENITSNA